MLLVFCQKITPRLDYIFKHIFEVSLDIPVQFTTKIDIFIAHNSIKMSYGKSPLGNEFFIQSTPLLFQQGLQDLKINVKTWKDHPCFFEVDEVSKIPFDVFAASFYLLSRYEEYELQIKDEEGRFLSENSLAVKHQFIDFPLIDFWTKSLFELLQESYPDLKLPSSISPYFLPLIEVVRPYKYRQKSFFKNCVQWIQSLFSLNLWEVIELPLVILRIRKDPWDSFDQFIEIFKSTNFKPHFFFLFTKNSFIDRGISINNTAFKSLIKGVSDYFKVDLLASYNAHSNTKVLRKEQSDFKSLIHREVKSIRFAWGIKGANESYRNLLIHEIENDFSMSYPDVIGYRASTAVPFYFYDLINELSTSLLIHPVVAQMSSLSSLPPKTAFSQLYSLERDLILSKSIHCVCFNNQILEYSSSNQALLQSFISYIESYD